MTISHSSGYEWELKLYFLNKENNHCSKHINSAIIQVVNAIEENQTIPCNGTTDNITCIGVVKMNHFNLCRPLPVNIGFQYSKFDEANRHISWIKKTLPPFVDEISRQSYKSLKINTTNRQRFEILWHDHVCLPNGSVSLWVLEIRQSNGIILKTLSVPSECSNTEKSKHHRVFLEEDKLMCQGNKILYYIQFAPCTDYLLSLTPVVKGTNGLKAEYSQSINFTSSFTPSSNYFVIVAKSYIDFRFN